MKHISARKLQAIKSSNYHKMSSAILMIYGSHMLHSARPSLGFSNILQQNIGTVLLSKSFFEGGEGSITNNFV
jgi:hypothetical protein